MKNNMYDTTGIFESSRHDDRDQAAPLIMIVGVGDLSKLVIDQLLTDVSTNKLVLVGRDLDSLDKIANLARYTATDLGREVEISTAVVDLEDVDHTSEVLKKYDPDIVLMTASLQPWHTINELPDQLLNRLYEAQLGPWLPLHLALNLNLMKAVKKAGIDPITVNAVFPDAVNPILDQVGLAPTVGVGNVANIIPALTFGVSALTGVSAQNVQVRLVAQHYFTHFVPRYGHKGNSAYHLSAEDLSCGNELEFSHEKLFKMLGGILSRQGGTGGQVLTAKSTAKTIRAIARDSHVVAHAPAPNGLPGGYPVVVNAHGASLNLPSNLSEAEAIAINQCCQEADGILHIDHEGTVWFTEREMNIMTELLGYQVVSLPVDEVWDRARELTRRLGDLKSGVSVTKLKGAA